MMNKKALLAVAVALVTALIVSSLAVAHTGRSETTQTNPDIVMFLKWWGTDGESTVSGYENWIDIDAFNWSEAMTALTSAVAGRTASKLSMTNFNFAMKTNKASPTLFLDCATARYRDATIDICTPVGESSPLVFLQFNLTQAAITRYGIAGNTPMDRPVDEFSIAFSKITMTYTQYDDSGNVIGAITVYYDLVAMRGGTIP
jgi:type VI secretion system secreted protein Hcp